MNLLRRLQAGRLARRLADGRHTGDELDEARRALVELGADAIVPVLDAVANGMATAAAADVLEQLLNGSTLGIYTEALASQAPSVVDTAAAALARNLQYDPALLLPLFSDPRVSKARLESILSAQADRLAPATLVRALPEVNKEARVSVFRLLERRADAGVVFDLLGLAKHAEWWFRLHAVRLLARFPGPPTVEGVRGCLTDDIPSVRLEAVRTLATLGASAAIADLCARLADADMKVQTAAIEALIALGDVAAVPHLIVHLKDESEYVRRGAVEVLNQVVTADAVKDLVNALRDSDWWVRVRAADALGSLGGPRVIDAVIGLVKDPDEFIRRYAVEILNLVPDQRAVDSLLTALEDPDWWVRERAIDALAKTGDVRAVEPLLRLMASDPQSVPLCVKALGQIPDPRAVQPLCDLVDSPIADVRREVIDALRRYTTAQLPEAWRDRVVQALGRASSPIKDAPAPIEVRPGFGPEAGRHENAPRTPPRGSAGAQQVSPVTPPSGANRTLNFQRLEPGTMLIDRFCVKERIGGGGFGTVYRVEDIAVREELVLKILSPQLSLDEAMLRRFVQELRLTRRITHRNVIRIHDLLDLQGAQAISMEYFPGQDLGRVLRDEGVLSVERVLGIAAQVIEGLTAAHELGIVHRDIKPANLLLGEGEHVKIVDFGLASVGQSTRSRLTQSGILVGTPEYISPEQITGHEVDGRTDLYSLGVVLYELLTGRQPFHGPNAVNVLFQHLEPDVPRAREVRAGIPDDVDELVMRCMSRFPDDRPQSARELLEWLPKAA